MTTRHERIGEPQRACGRYTDQRTRCLCTIELEGLSAIGARHHGDQERRSRGLRIDRRLVDEASCLFFARGCHDPDSLSRSLFFYWPCCYWHALKPPGAVAVQLFP